MGNAFTDIKPFVYTPSPHLKERLAEAERTQHSRTVVGDTTMGYMHPSSVVTRQRDVAKVPVQASPEALKLRELVALPEGNNYAESLLYAFGARDPDGINPADRGEYHRLANKCIAYLQSLKFKKS